MRPMLATRGRQLPTGADWRHEVKWDGMRVLAEVGPGSVRLTSRNENDVSVAFPELQGLTGVAHGLLLDGEVVAFAGGIPTFGALAERIHVGSPRRAALLAERSPVTLLVFDLLRRAGEDLTGWPWAARREALESVGLGAACWQVPPVYDDGLMLRQATLDQGLEGVVSKRVDSRYTFGARSPHWLKFPHRRRASYVVGGWRPETGSETGSAQRLGAVLVGQPTAAGLVYRGRVGSGISGKVGAMLHRLLAPLARADSPFADEVPRLDAAGTHWVEPVVVVDVEALGLSPQQRLRQPAYRGVRADLTPEDL